jgi:nucleoside diphosphate kinase
MGVCLRMRVCGPDVGVCVFGWLQLAAIEHLPRSHEAQEHMRRRVNEMKEEAETAEALHRRRRMQSTDGPVVEHTLALLKPDFVKKGDMAVARLLSRLRYDGFAIVRQKKLEPVLKRDLAHALYKEHENRSFFPKLMDYMASGPAFAIELQAVDGVRKWRDMIGPTDPAVAKVEAPQSLRAKHVRVCW